MTPSSTAGPDKVLSARSCGLSVTAFSADYFCRRLYSRPSGKTAARPLRDRNSCLSDRSFVIFYRFRSRMSSFCAFLHDIFAALRSLCTRPITLLLYFTILRAGCHPFAPFYAIFLPPCAHSADEADIFWRLSFPPGIDAADALTISGCGMIKVIGFGFSLPTLKAPSEFSGNKPDLPRFLSARKPHRGGRVFCPFLPSFSVLRKTWLQAHGLFYCF